MTLKKWTELPDFMRTQEVREYYNIVKKKQGSMLIKRIFDIVVSAIMVIIVSPIMLIISVMIKCDSRGPVFFRQERITQYGRVFRIYKFRTMVNHAERLGTQVTVEGDMRITRIGKLLRKVRFDEIPQLFNILTGDMTFVGTRPEVQKYVDAYTNEMYATLLVPAGLTSKASIEYKDEDKLLEGSKDVDATYIKEVLPQKMRYNLESIRNFGLLSDIITMLSTAVAVLR